MYTSCSQIINSGEFYEENQKWNRKANVKGNINFTEMLVLSLSV